MSDRAGYLNLPQLDVAAEPHVNAFRHEDGSTIAVVQLGAGSLTIHVETAAGARALADAFTHAADLIQAAGTEGTP